MRLLQIFVDSVVPVLLVAAAGAASARWLGVEAGRLAKLAYWVFGPAFVFDQFARAELPAALVLRMVGASVGGMAAAALVVLGVRALRRRDYPTVAAEVTTAVHGNVGNFGLALVVFTFGTQALPLATVALIVINTVGLLVGVASAAAQRTSFLRAVATGLLAPMTLAVLPAVLVNVGDVTLPLWLSRPISLLAAALIPVTLLALGVQLVSLEVPGFPRGGLLPLVAKLAVAPAAAAVFAGALGISGLARGVVILQSAMPAAVLTAVVAIEHRLVPEKVSGIVVAGTLISILTLPVVIALVS